jgi:hypothetical protein
LLSFRREKQMISDEIRHRRFIVQTTQCSKRVSAPVVYVSEITVNQFSSQARMCRSFRAV